MPLPRRVAAPARFGADVVAYSATKLMDGQGRVLAGAVCGTAEFINDVLLPFQRNTGPTLSPFNAWVVLKGLETLELRAPQQHQRAAEMDAERLEHPQRRLGIAGTMRGHPPQAAQDQALRVLAGQGQGQGTGSGGRLGRLRHRQGSAGGESLPS
jgi:cystathionine beta-lyase/cystathionine gamma-synthase